MEPSNCECHGVPQIWQRLKRRDREGYWRCRVKHQEAGKRWNAKADRRATNRANNARRILIAQRYHSFASSAAEAQAINAHIKGRLHAFKQGQQSRADSQSGTPR